MTEPDLSRPSVPSTVSAPSDIPVGDICTPETSPTSRVTLDAGSPYAELKPQAAGAYVKVQVTGHPIARADGRALLHRLVLFDAIGAGPHACELCGQDGLDWFVKPGDVDYLTVDHRNGNEVDDRRSNLRPTHKWCNDNRHVVEGHGIGWEFVSTIPVRDRKPLWNHQRGCLTPGAYAYQKQVAGAPVPQPIKPANPDNPRLPIRRGLVRWEDLPG